MLNSILVRVVNYCTRFAWTVILAFVAAALACGFFAADRFAINTDVNKLISPHLEWRKRELAFEAAFHGRYDSILVVVNAPTPELATQAATALAGRLRENPQLFPTVRLAGGDAFFERNGLLFLPTAEVEQVTHNLGESAQLITDLAGDPSLRGVTQALSLALTGVQQGMLPLDAMTRPLTMAANTVDDVLAGRPASFSWRSLISGKDPTPSDLRRFIDVRPVLDFAALEPGAVPSEAIRQAARDLNLGETYRARVRLTGPVPIADEEFGTVREGAIENAIGTVLIVLVILWLALRSPKIILAVFINLFVGLAITAAIGLALVGALNLISVAFAVLFVGLGVDFGIQFAVRYRAARHDVDDIRGALAKAAREIGAPLTLAAAAVTAAFLSFLPTAYQGVSELGQIAGVGMIVAFVTSVTLLPALLRVLNPAGEPEPVGYKALAPVDRFLERHRIAVVAGTAIVAIAGLPLLYYLRFDFNPINLRSPAVESVATFLELRSDPVLGANAINVLAASASEAAAAAERLRQLPEVSRTITLESFVPEDQDRKLQLIQQLKTELEPALQPDGASEAPSDEQNVEALKSVAQKLTETAGTENGSGAAAAKRLADLLTKLANGEKSLREKADMAFVPPLRTVLGEMKNYLQAEKITLDNLPEDIVSDWVAKDGRTRVEVQPSGDPNDNETLRKFARAVLNVYPAAVGGPIAILESGHTMIKAFFQAGAWALISIALLLWIVLRRFGDVLLTLVPLIVAGVITLEACVLLGLPLNFANIIALPLLLGLGVAFKIYYITAWRAGQTDLLQSSLTRAVIWSALTTATAFGSLWLSSHPGTSSMGKLLALSLVCTMCAAVLFQPALMGKPREIEEH